MDRWFIVEGLQISSPLLQAPQSPLEISGAKGVPNTGIEESRYLGVSLVTGLAKHWCVPPIDSGPILVATAAGEQSAQPAIVVSITPRDLHQLQHPPHDIGAHRPNFDIRK